MVWYHKESNTAEQLTFTFFHTVLQGTWRRKWQTTPVILPGKSHRQGQAAIHGVAKSRTWLSDLAGMHILHRTQKPKMEQNHNNFRSSINSEDIGSGKSSKLNGSKINIKNWFIESALRPTKQDNTWMGQEQVCVCVCVCMCIVCDCDHSG